MNKEKLARDFIRQFEKSWPADLRQALSILADDAYYQMVVPTIKSVHGKEAIIDALEVMKTKVADQRHEIINVASSGDVVFTERIDYSLRHQKWVPIPLVAVFEINDEGKICTWREYLDLYSNMKNHGLSFEEMKETIDAL
ncbi:MAG: limonene-1,2-epoxide hydrolase family protein [Spongiibacteraceae bacterium]